MLEKKVFFPATFVEDRRCENVGIEEPARERHAENGNPQPCLGDWGALSWCEAQVLLFLLSVFIKVCGGLEARRREGTENLRSEVCWWFNFISCPEYSCVHSKSLY